MIDSIFIAQFRPRFRDLCIRKVRNFNVYLCTVLGLGHSYQELEDGLGLGHKRGDGMDDSGELWVGFNTWKTRKNMVTGSCSATNQQ